MWIAEDSVNPSRALGDDQTRRREEQDSLDGSKHLQSHVRYRTGASALAEPCGGIALELAAESQAARPRCLYAGVRPGGGSREEPGCLTLPNRTLGESSEPLPYRLE